MRARFTGNDFRKTHGKTKTPEFAVWNGMISRCTNPNHRAYASYGGRGISVCDRWLDSFQSFLDDMGSANGLTLERIDNDGDYTPENCRWATYKEQAYNRRSNRYITVDGVEKTITEWATDLGTTDPAIRNRLSLGWTEREAVLTPVKQYTRR